MSIPVDPGGSPALAAFVGRERELALVEGRLEAALAGSLQIVLASGEPGIGKTRLLDETAARATRRGVTVLRGGASEAEGMPAYLPFLEALGQHIRAESPDRLREQIGVTGSVLATILPELSQRLGPLPEQYTLPPEQARWRLYAAAGDFLAAIARRGGLLLILDDLQFADSATLDLLTYVARHQTAVRLLVLGAYREGEAVQQAGFERAIVDLTRTRLLTTLPLGPLTSADIDRLAAGYLGGRPRPELSQLLAGQSEGNPFFAEELLRGWQEMGVIGQAGDRWTVAGPITSALLPGIAAAIRQRLSRLAPSTVALLHAAAVAGRSFDLALLAGAVGQDAEGVQEQLREAVRAGLLRVDAGDRYTFGHDKIRECLYEEVVPVRRRRLHGFIGRALEETSDPGDAHRMAELAFHFVRSGDRGRGAHYARLAAEQAMAAYAPEEALGHYDAALVLLDAADPGRGALLIARGTAAELAGQERAAAEAFEAAQAWFQARGNPAGAAQALHHLGRAFWRQESTQAARAAFESALRLPDGVDDAERVELLVDLGSLTAVSLHNYATGLDYSRQALALARRLEDESLLARACRTHGNLLVRSNSLAAGTLLLEQGLALATAAGDAGEAAECCAALVVACFWQGAFRRARHTLAQQQEHAQHSHDPYQLRHVYVWQALFDAFEGRLPEAESLLDQAGVIVERLASPEPRAWLHFSRGGLAYLRGAYAEAEQWIQQAVALFRSIGPDALVWYLGWLALAQAAQGKAPEAQACMDEVEALVARLPEGAIVAAEPLSHLTQAALALHDRTRLRRYYPRLLAFGGQYHDALIDRLLGEIETLEGDWAAAQAHLDAAERIARQEDHLWEVARTLEARADLAAAQGNRGATTLEQSQALLEQARTLFERGSFRGEAVRVSRRLANPRGPRRRASLPAGLSEREVEVLRLVASGKSNREIADALYLSEHTVAHHLTSIFNKTGVDNRAAASAFAVSQGLVHN